MTKEILQRISQFSPHKVSMTTAIDRSIHTIFYFGIYKVHLAVLLPQEDHALMIVNGRNDDSIDLVPVYNIIVLDTFGTLDDVLDKLNKLIKDNNEWQ